MPDYLSRAIFEGLQLPKNVILKAIEADEDGRYWILSDGRVLSVCREKPYYKNFTDDGNGYLYIKINNKKCYQHRLLALNFNLDKQKEKNKEQYEVHHLDFDKSNNELSNLCLVPPSKHRAIHSIHRRIEKWEKENNI